MRRKRLGAVALAIALYLRVAFPAFSAGADSQKNDWNRLNGLSKNQNVKVRLRDGRVLRGTIQQFGPDGLAFMEEKKLSRVKFGQVEGPVRCQAGQTVELKLRDGRVLSGRVQTIDSHDELLWLAETAAAEQVLRQDVVRVTRNNRLRSAGIGAFGGAAVLTGIFVAGPKDSLKPGESAAGAWAGLVVGGVALGGLIGAGIGAAIGYPQTIYEAGPSK